MLHPSVLPGTREMPSEYGEEPPGRDKQFTVILTLNT